MVVAEETPVNPYSLLEAINTSSTHAQTFTYYFLALMGFYLVSIIPMNHADLAANTFISLPQGIAKISVTTFFTFSPIFLFFAHLIVLVTHFDLYTRLKEFNGAVSTLESREGNHPLRLETNAYFYTQSIAGTRTNIVFDFFLRAVVWGLLIFLPATLLLSFQIKFLPYHDIYITWLHRILIILDALVVASLGLTVVSKSIGGAGLSALQILGQRLIFTGFFSIVLALSLIAATIPGERIDRMLLSISPLATDVSNDPAVPRHAFFLTAILFEGQIDDVTGNISSLFSRNIIAIDSDFALDALKETGKRGANFRGRDFSFARFDRADVRKADFTGANLSGAHFRGKETLLKEATFKGANLAGVLFEEVNLDNVDFAGSNVSEARFVNCWYKGQSFTGRKTLSDFQ